MIMTNTGIRISLGTKSRTKETKILDPTNTNNVATPKPNALVIVAVTASSGHNPNNCTNPGLFFHSP